MRWQNEANCAIIDVRSWHGDYLLISFIRLSFIHLPNSLSLAWHARTQARRHMVPAVYVVWVAVLNGCTVKVKIVGTTAIIFALEGHCSGMLGRGHRFLIGRHYCRFCRLHYTSTTISWLVWFNDPRGNIYDLGGVSLADCKLQSAFCETCGERCERWLVRYTHGK